MTGPATRYVVGQVVNDQTYGLVTIQEVHQPTLNSPEQYGFLQNSTGSVYRATLLQVGESTQAAEVEAAIDAALVVQTPIGT